MSTWLVILFKFKAFCFKTKKEVIYNINMSKTAFWYTAFCFKTKKTESYVKDNSNIQNSSQNLIDCTKFWAFLTTIEYYKTYAFLTTLEQCKICAWSLLNYHVYLADIYEYIHLIKKEEWLGKLRATWIWLCQDLNWTILFSLSESQ